MIPIQDPNSNKRFVLTPEMERQYIEEVQAADPKLTAVKYYHYISLWLQVHGEEV